MEIDNIEQLYESMPNDIIVTFSTKEQQKFRIDSEHQSSIQTEMDENALDLVLIN